MVWTEWTLCGVENGVSGDVGVVEGRDECVQRSRARSRSRSRLTSRSMTRTEVIA